MVNKAKQRLAIVGAGGHGRVIADLALHAQLFDSVVFFDDNIKPAGISALGERVGAFDQIAARSGLFDQIIVGVGDNQTRLQISQHCLSQDLSMATIIHPTACVSAHARIGAGSVVFAQSVVNIGSHLGCAVIVNTGVIVEHDAQLADGVHICPGAALAGRVSVGSCSCVGIGASVVNGVAIGADSIVGAGAAVTANLPDRVMAVGVPAKIIRQL